MRISVRPGRADVALAGRAERPRDTLIYRRTLLAVAAFQALHLWLLPFVISPDGLDYVWLARLFGEGDLWERWHYMRMPLYPLLLRASFEMFGTNTIAALLPGTVLAFIGLWMLAAEIRIWAGPRSGAAVLLLLSGFPLLIAYEHAVLTEAGTSGVLAAVVALGLRLVRQGLQMPTVISLAALLTFGYLFRATTMALVPAAALLVAMSWWSATRAGDVPRRGAHWRGALALLMVVGLPATAARAWHADGRAQRISFAFESNLVGYAVQQGVIAPEDPIAVAAADGTSRLRAIVAANPVGYVQAAAGSLAIFAGVPGPPSDNRLILSSTHSLAFPGSKCVCPGSDTTLFEEFFRRPGGVSPLHFLLKVLQPIYVPLVLIGWAATSTALVLGVVRSDARLFTVAVFPVAFASAHAVLVLNLDRFAVPSHLLALANVCLVWRAIRGDVPAAPNGETV